MQLLADEDQALSVSRSLETGLSVVVVLALFFDTAIA